MHYMYINIYISTYTFIHICAHAHIYHLPRYIKILTGTNLYVDRKTRHIDIHALN